MIFKLTLLKEFLYLLVITLSAYTSFAALPASDIKGLEAVLEAPELSLIRGMVFKKGGILENALELTPRADKHPVLAIIDRLYTRVGWEFVPTRLGSNPAAHLHPYLLGKVALELWHLRFKLDDLSQLTHENLIEKYGTLSKKFAKQSRNKIIKSLKTLLPTSASANIAELIKNDDQFRSARGEYSRLFLENGQDIYNEGTSFDNGIKSLANMFTKAVSLSDDDLSIFKVIAALASDKINDKKGAFDYLKGIYDQATKNGCVSRIFNDTVFLTDPYQNELWLSQKFSDQYVTNPLSSDYEVAVFSLLGGSEFSSWIAPFLPTWGSAKLSSGHSFPDCTETSLLNLLRVILSDPSTEQVILPLWNNIHPKVIDFFTDKAWKTKKDDSDLKALLSVGAKNAWAEVASNLSTNVSYRSNENGARYNIKTSYSNIIALVRELFAVDGLKELINKVNLVTNKNIGMSENIAHDSGIITFDVPNCGIFIWKIDLGHSHFSVLPAQQFNPDTLKDLLSRPQPFFDLASLIRDSLANNKYQVLAKCAQARRVNGSYALFLHSFYDETIILGYARNVFESDEIVNLIGEDTTLHMVSMFAKRLHTSSLKLALYSTLEFSCVLPKIISLLYNQQTDSLASLTALSKDILSNSDLWEILRLLGLLNKGLSTSMECNENIVALVANNNNIDAFSWNELVLSYDEETFNRGRVLLETVLRGKEFPNFQRSINISAESFCKRILEYNQTFLTDKFLSFLQWCDKHQRLGALKKFVSCGGTKALYLLLDHKVTLKDVYIDYGIQQGNLLHFLLDLTHDNVNKDHISKLITQGINLNEVNICGYSPLALVLAKDKPDYALAEWLIQQGASTHGVIHKMKISDCLEKIQFLVDNGADVNELNQEYKVVLDYAEKEEIINYLVTKGSKKTGESWTDRVKTLLPTLIKSEKEGDFDTLWNLLIEINQLEDKQLIAQIINHQDDQGDTILHLALEKSNQDLINLIFTYTAPDVTLQNKRGESPSSLAILKELSLE